MCIRKFQSWYWMETRKTVMFYAKAVSTHTQFFINDPNCMVVVVVLIPVAETVAIVVVPVKSRQQKAFFQFITAH